MSLLEEIEASTRRPGTRCGVAIAAEALSKADQADFYAAIGRSEIPASAIGRTLRARNVKITDEALNRHRRGECACPTS